MRTIERSSLGKRLQRAATLEIRATTCALLISVMIAVLVATMFSLSRVGLEYASVDNAPVTNCARPCGSIQSQILRGILVF
jgi:hypothetical protein